MEADGARDLALPPEMLERVFLQLPPSSLKVVVLVCRRWREVGEAPGLWAWVVIRVTRENMSNMVERLDCRRLRAVRELRVKCSVGQTPHNQLPKTVFSTVLSNSD